MSRNLICSIVVVLMIAQAAAAARTWKSEGGAFTVEGDLIEVRQNEIVLRRQSDGEFLLVEMADLSADDRKYIDENRPAGGVVFNSELQATLDAAREAVAGRNLTNAAQLMTQASRQVRTPAEQQQVDQALRFVSDVDGFWRAYRAALAKMDSGHELSIGGAAFNIVENRNEALLVKTARGTVQFDLRNLQGMPAALAVAIAEKQSPSDPDVARGVQAFLRAEQFVAVDRDERDRQLWQEALAAASTPDGDMNTTRPKFGEEPTEPDQTLLAAPSAEEQEQARKLIRELYRESFADARRDDQKTSLANKLYLDAQQKSIEDSAVARYAMVCEAANLVAETGNIAEALSYFEALEGHFQPEALVAPKATALATASRKPKDMQTHFNVIEICYNSFAAAIANDDFESVDKLAETALAAARMLKDRKLQVQVDKKKEELSGLRTEYRDARDAMNALSESPDDAAANLKVGTYYCFAKGDWEVGLPHLVKGSEARLVELAQADLAAQSAAAGLAGAADGWWTLSEEGPYSRYAKNLQARAAELYQQALPQLKDLAKVAAETRIKQVNDAAAAEKFRAPQFETVPLAQLPVLATLDLHPPLGASTSRPITTATINGKQFVNSVWGQPSTTDGASKIAFKLDKKYLTLSGVVGFSDSGLRSTVPTNSTHSIFFRIVGASGGKEKLLWAAPGPIVRGQMLPFRVDVRNVDVVTLIAACDGYYMYVPAVWGSPTLTKAE